MNALQKQVLNMDSIEIEFTLSETKADLYFNTITLYGDVADLVRLMIKRGRHGVFVTDFRASIFGDFAIAGLPFEMVARPSSGSGDDKTWLVFHHAFRVRVVADSFAPVAANSNAKRAS